MSVVFAYVTFPTQAEARAIADVLVTERLAACANILPEMTSVYHWQGNIQRSSEVIVVFKTQDSLWVAFEGRIKDLHSYDTPCIAGWPLTRVSNEFMKWVEFQTERNLP